jgi:hypothetical protein
MLFSAHFFYTPIAEFQTKKRGRTGGLSPFIPEQNEFAWK